jgi:singapore isolate B (sub-type 7) whole genome shotgun sequence assembly, scaffold_6
VNRLPTLWGFIDFNYTAKSTSKQPITTFTPVLTPAKWKYPEDCFYIKMFVLCPRIHLEHAFGERHGFGDKKCNEVISE